MERAFGVLQSRWHILSRPDRFFSKSFMGNIVKCCIILHNMRVEDREDVAGRAFDEQEEVSNVTMGEEAVPMWGSLEQADANSVLSPGSLAALCELSAFTGNYVEYRNTKTLIMNHLWETKGSLSLYRLST